MDELLRLLISKIENAIPPQLPVPLLLTIFAGFVLLLLFTVTVCLLRLRNASRIQGVLKAKLQNEKEHSGTLSQTINRQKVQEAKLITLLKNERKHSSDKLKLLEEARHELSLQFENLANKIIEEKSSQFTELNKEKLEAVLSPFNSHLINLKQEIDSVYRADSRERMSLKNEIIHLKELNQKINQEAINLTRALKGDKRTQGAWGELVLEKVLENSGLRKDIEYKTQAGFRDSTNRLSKPDVIVHLPGGKDIVIDSKVSLISWEKYIASETQDEKTKNLAKLKTAIQNHISTLSNKSYQDLDGIRSLDFVLMFLPIEGAFRAICEKSDTLFVEALAKNIIIVTPTTLLTTLRTIENLWRWEQQSKNSLEIAKRAGLMYDKFRGFAEELEKLGKQLTTCQNSYEGAISKLTRGRGNLVSQAEQLKDLGVQTKSKLPKNIKEKSDLCLKN